MATIAVLTLLAFVQAVFGRPIYIDAFYNLGNGLTPIVVSRLPVTAPYQTCSLFGSLSIQMAPQTTQTVHVHSIDALLPHGGLFETRSASSDPSMTTTLLDAIGASTMTPATLWASKGALALAVIIPLVAVVIPLIAWFAYKTNLVPRRTDSLAAPTPVSPTPLIANIRVVAVTEVPAKFEEDETMRGVRDFWSPISPGPPELHVEYKNMDTAIGTAVNPTATHLPLLARDASGFFYDSDHPAALGSDIAGYTLRSPSVDQDASSAAPEAGRVEDVAHHEHIPTNSVVDNRGVCTRPSTPISVRTVCTLTSISSSSSLNSLETPKEADHFQRTVLVTVNQIPVIRITEATPERSEKLCGHAQRFNSRAITPRQARLQNLI